ncbi:MAG TPA: pyridoxal phosphate-dependent aminotransferase [Thermoanaerobaculia bacterium]|jgi:aspartate aminotransferase|nr:pyridoxal phosphate-dependent aminotransferase [Thermoanaerobaculia bacterium]
MRIDVITKPRIRLTRRVNEMQVSPTLAVMNRALELKAQGIDVVDLGPGEPDFPTPQSVCAAGKRAIDEGQTKYTAGNGTKALRDALAARYNRRYGTSIKAENVIAGTGGKQELFNVTLALVDEGDEVIIPSPYWVSFPDQVQFAGGTPVFAPADPQNEFRPTFADIEAAATERTRGVIINSPCNPTGAVIAEKELRRIVEWCASRDLFLMFDETYEFFVYDGAKHVSAGRWFDEYPETVVCINSMSKTFAMTGWRLGYAIAHREVITAAGKIQSHSTSNPSSISQAAALEALAGGDDEVRRMWEAYRDRRAWLIPAINGIDGLCCAHPDGAFYIFPDVSAFFGRGSVRDSQTLTNYLLDEARVAVIPGAAFGSNDHVRISYATSMERLQEGVRRIGSALRNLR